MPWSGAAVESNGPRRRWAAGSPVARSDLVRVLAVAERLDLLEGDREARGIRIGRAGEAWLVGELDARGGHPRRQLRGDAGIVGGGVAEGLDREGRPEPGRDAPLLRQGRQDRRVALRRGNDSDRGVVLGRRPDHRRPADVDLLDELVERDPVAFSGGGERVEIHDDELERRDRRRDELPAVVGQAAVREDAAVDPRVERLDPPVEHLGEAGHRGDVRHGQTCVAEGARRAAGRDELETGVDEAPAEIGEAGLVGHGQERPTRDGNGSVRPVRIERDSPSVRPDRQGAGDEERDGPRQEAVLDRTDPVVERSPRRHRAGSRRPPGRRSGRRRASRRRDGLSHR